MTNASIGEDIQQHLQKYSQEAANLAKLLVIDSSWEVARHAPAPLFHAWLEIDKYHVAVYDEHPGTLGAEAEYMLLRGPPAGVTNYGPAAPLPSALPNEHRQNDRMIFVYGELQRSQTSAQRRAVVERCARLYAATCGFYGRVGACREFGKIVNRARKDGNLGSEVDQATLYSSLTVFLAAGLEVGLREFLLAWDNHWFLHMTKKDWRRAMKQVAKRLVRPRTERRQFLRQIRLVGWSPKEATQLIKSRKEWSRINFQDLSKKGGHWLYGPLLGISVPKVVDENDPGAWSRTKRLLARRHLIVHRGAWDKSDRLELQQEIATVQHLMAALVRVICERDEVVQRAPI